MVLTFLAGCRTDLTCINWNVRGCRSCTIIYTGLFFIGNFLLCWIIITWRLFYSIYRHTLLTIAVLLNNPGPLFSRVKIFLKWIVLYLTFSSWILVTVRFWPLIMVVVVDTLLAVPENPPRGELNKLFLWEKPKVWSKESLW